jgi:hypothetical protein
MRPSSEVTMLSLGYKKKALCNSNTAFSGNSVSGMLEQNACETSFQ